jgi:hypothetical protein
MADIIKLKTDKETAFHFMPDGYKVWPDQTPNWLLAEIKDEKYVYLITTIKSLEAHMKDIFYGETIGRAEWQNLRKEYAKSDKITFIGNLELLSS